MLKIKRFNTAFWGFIRTPEMGYECSDKVNAFIGQSGSGKTTIMDSIRIILGDANFENNRKMDHYLNPSSNWAVVAAVLGNSVQEEEPFKRLGYKENDVTVCVRIDRSGAKIERTYYLFDGVFKDIGALGVNPNHYKLCRVEYSAYVKILEDAGITAAFKRLMTMRPEEIQNIVDLQPVQLFDRVFQLRGQKTIQDKHDEAETKVTLLMEKEKETMEQLSEAEAKLKTYEEKKSIFDSYTEKHNKHKKLDRLLRKRRYYDTQEAIVQQIEQKREVENQREEITITAESDKKKLRYLEEDKEKYSKLLEEAKISKEKAFDEMNSLRDELGKTDILLSNKVESIKEVEGIPEENLPELEKIRQENEHLLDDLKHKYMQLDMSRKDVEGKILTISKGNSTLPTWVKIYREILEHKNIHFIMLADCISIKQEYLPWVADIEGVLGRERFRMIVNEEQYLEAKKVQEQYEFGARVCLSKPLVHKKKISLLKGKYINLYDALDILHETRVGGWLEQYRNIYLVETVEEGHRLQGEGYITLTQKGLLQDQGGAIFLKSKELICGKLAREHYKILLQQKLENLSKEIQHVIEESRPLEDTKKKLNNCIENQQKRLQLPRIWEERSELEQALTQAKVNWEDARGFYKLKEDRMEEYSKEIQEKEIEANTIQENIKSSIKYIEYLDKSINGHEGEITKQKRLFEIYKQHLQEIGLTEDDMEFIKLEVEKEKIFNKDPELELTREYLEKRTEELKQEKEKIKEKCRGIDESVIAMVEPQKNRVTDLKEQAQRASDERKDWEDILGEAKTALKYHVREIMNEYIEEFKDMAELLGATSVGKFEQDGDDYRRWKLIIKVGFDGKKAEPYFDPSFSKGQRAALSIMLLLAAINNKKEGSKNSIMFLDEPTSRVDDYRAEEIGRILQKAGIQFFITHQISASLQTSNWINNGIILSKLKIGQEFADDPIIEIRRVEAYV